MTQERMGFWEFLDKNFDGVVAIAITTVIVIGVVIVCVWGPPP